MMCRVTVTGLLANVSQREIHDLHCGFTNIAFSPVAYEEVSVYGGNSDGITDGMCPNQWVYR